MSTKCKSSSLGKRISSSWATGGFGVHFESDIQASFVILMLTGGYAPGLPSWPIIEIKLQAKDIGIGTDDFIITVKDNKTDDRRKMLGQIKSGISFNKSKDLEEFFKAAWDDFNGKDFVRGRDGDRIALITGPMSATDIKAMHFILDEARHTKDANEFFHKMELLNYRPSQSDKKLQLIRDYLDQAKRTPVSNEELYSFLIQFLMFGYDMGSEVGVVKSLLCSHISQFNKQYPDMIWSHAVKTVETFNQSGGTITYENLPPDLRDEFKVRVPAQIPTELLTQPSDQPPVDWNRHPQANALAVMNLVGSWNEKTEADSDIVGRIAHEL
jgi:hypothetical protein